MLEVRIVNRKPVGLPDVSGLSDERQTTVTAKMFTSMQAFVGHALDDTSVS